MNIKNRFLIFFISSLFSITFLVFPVNAKTKYPDPTSYKYLNDYVGVMNKEDTEKVISIGKELEDKTGAQAITVIIDSTNNTPIESYANELFRTWGIGQKEKDNGLLLLVAINDKSWRVEVGRGLEGAIPDALSNNVMISLAKPNFAQNNYSTGISESYSTLCDYIASEYNITLDKSLKISLPNPNTKTSSSRSYGTMAAGTFLVLFILDMLLNRGRVSSTLLQLLFWSNIGRGPRGRGGSSGGFGGFGGGSSNGGGSSGSW